MPSRSSHKTSLGMVSKGQNSGLRVLIACIVASVLLFNFSYRDSNFPLFTAARSVVNIAALPVRYLSAVVWLPFRAAAGAASDASAPSASLSELKSKNQELEAQVARLEEDRQKVERLQNLLALKSSYNLQSVACRIIAGAHNSWEHTVTIDKGSLAGLSVGMPVVDSNGAIGQITECNAASSTVRLISDERSQIPAMIQSSRAQGSLQGSVDGNLYLKFINTNLSCEVGDTVVTSGLGGIFPKGIPIGKIASVNKTPGAMYFDIRLSTLTSAENLEEVLVITSLTDEQKASDKDIAEADTQDRSVGDSSSAASGKNGSAASDGAKSGDGSSSASSSGGANGNNARSAQTSNSDAGSSSSTNNSKDKGGA